jgi:ABC-type multidrug transport system ATPase subunit
MQPVIQVEHLRKVYGSMVAVDDISFEVNAGEIFGMVGPNGAGKTSTAECVEGLRPHSGGSIRVMGYDPQKDRYALRGVNRCLNLLTEIDTSCFCRSQIVRHPCVPAAFWGVMT